MRKHLLASAGVACGFAAVAAVGVAVLGSCLRADDRPNPGMLMLTVSPSAAVTDGITTVDGWRIT